MIRFTEEKIKYNKNQRRKTERERKTVENNVRWKKGNIFGNNNVKRNEDVSTL